MTLPDATPRNSPDPINIKRLLIPKTRANTKPAHPVPPRELARQRHAPEGYRTDMSSFGLDI